jgi:hypothetical protein
MSLVGFITFMGVNIVGGAVLVAGVLFGTWAWTPAGVEELADDAPMVVSA